MNEINNDKKLISVITPCYNEELNIQTCCEEVKKLFHEKLINYDYEHIFSDNASQDNTVKILKEIASQDKKIKIIVNSRNYGPFCSMFNALKNASGDAVIVMLAADLQDPPEIIADFVEHWEKGYEIIYGVRAKREEGLIMKFVRDKYYKLVNKFADINIPVNAGEFQLIDKIVLKALLQHDDYYPYVRGMIANCGFKSIGVEYTWKARKRGFSKNKLYSLIDQGLNGLISFTNIPMRLCMFAGFGIAVISILYAIFTVVINLVYFRQIAPPGIPTIIAALFFFGGIQLFFLGILGEYISAIHFQVRKKPLVIEREKINFL